MNFMYAYFTIHTHKMHKRFSKTLPFLLETLVIKMIGFLEA